MKTSFRKSSLTQKLRRVSALLGYQTKEEGSLNQIEKKNRKKSVLIKNFRRRKLYSVQFWRVFFLNFCILFGESFPRTFYDIDFWKDDFVPHPFEKIARSAELGFAGYAAETVT